MSTATKGLWISVPTYFQYTETIMLHETHLEAMASQLTGVFFFEEALDLFLAHSLLPSFDFQ